MKSVPKAFIFIAATACLSFGSGCMPNDADGESSNDSEELESTESNVDILILPGCHTAAADKVYFVTNGTGAITAASPDGGYHYSTSDSCNRWVADFKFGTTSPIRNLTASPYDLPSSSGAGGRWPTNAYDCTHLQVATSIYRKRSTEATFTMLTSTNSTGVWSGGTCHATIPLIQAHPSTAGWDTYRVAVSTKLRGAWQQTAAREELPPPG